MTKARLKPNQSLEIDVGDGPEYEGAPDYDATLAEILTEFDASPADHTYNVKVYRVPVRADGTGIRGLKPEYLFEGDQTVVPGIMDYCRDTQGYGTGTYRAIIRRDNAPFRQFDFRVFKPGSAMVAVPSNENNQIVETLRDVLKQQNERMERMEERLISAPVPVDEMTRLKTLSEIMKNLRGDEARPQQSEGASMANSIGLITTVLALTDKLRGDSAPVGGSSWQDIGFKFVEGLSNGNIKLSDLGNALVPAKTKPTAPPDKQIAPPVVSMATTPKTEEPPPDMVQVPVGDGKFFSIPRAMFNRINEMILTLCRNARRFQNDPVPHREPAAFVDMVLDELEELDPSGNLSTTLVGTPTSLDLLTNAFPATVPYRDWFATLLEECRAAIAGPGNEGQGDNACGADCPAGQTAGSHAGNAQNHAAFDTTGEA